jgi:hypothetical protein
VVNITPCFKLRKEPQYPLKRLLYGPQKNSFVPVGVPTPDLAACSIVSTPKLQVTYFMAFNPSKIYKTGKTTYKTL